MRQRLRKVPVVTALEEFVNQQIKNRFRTAAGLARRLGVTHTTLSRGLRAGTFDVDNLLRLAQVTNTPASEVLRLGQKHAFADLVEELYGPSCPEPLPPDVLRLARRLCALDAPAIAALEKFVIETIGTRPSDRAR